MRNLIDIIRMGLKSRVGENIVSLYFLLATYYILPLITVPYLVRVLKPEMFGLVAFGQSLMTFFTLFVNYGFDMTATRTISINRDDAEHVSRISCSVWSAKALLCAISLLALLLMMLFVDKIKQNSILVLILFGIPIGNMLFPNWLFLGLERMKAISVINIVMRVITTLLIFILIRAQDDYIIYAGLLSFQWVFAGISGLFYSIFSLNIEIGIPGLKDVLQVMSEGWKLFISNMARSVYFSGNSFILGILTNYTVVGYYSAAEKIILSLVSFFRPVAQAVFPRFAQMASESKNSVLLWGRRMVIVMGFLGILASSTIFLGSHFIVEILLGKGFGPSVIVLQILSILPLLMVLSDIFSNQIMLPFSKDSFYCIIRIITSVLHVLLALLIVPKLQERGMALVFVLSQAFILVSTFIFLWFWELTPFHYKSDEKLQTNPVNSRT